MYHAAVCDESYNFEKGTESPQVAKLRWLFSTISLGSERCRPHAIHYVLPDSTIFSAARKGVSAKNTRQLTAATANAPIKVTRPRRGGPKSEPFGPRARAVGWRRCHGSNVFNLFALRGTARSEQR